MPAMDSIDSVIVSIKLRRSNAPKLLVRSARLFSCLSNLPPRSSIILPLPLCPFPSSIYSPVVGPAPPADTFDFKAGAGQVITDVSEAEARSAGEIVVDEGDGAERVVAFLEKLKVV